MYLFIYISQDLLKVMLRNIFSKNHELKTRKKYNFLSFILDSTMPNCSVVGCDYGLAKKDGTYVSYRLPKDPKISQKWLELLNRDNYVPSINTCICHRHFEEDAFFRFVHVFTKKSQSSNSPIIYTSTFYG